MTKPSLSAISAFYTVSYIETDLPEDTPILGGALLDIPVLDGRSDFTSLDKIIFHVSQNIHVPTNDEVPLGFAEGIGVSEIVGRDGYYFANSRTGVLETVNPFYEVHKTGHRGVFETNENGISIRLVFSEEAEGGKVTLIHAWPNRSATVRKFLQLGGPYKIPDLSFFAG